MEVTAPAEADDRPRVWPGVAVRVAVVVVASAVAYAFVVPVDSVERARLDSLVATTTGSGDFPGRPAAVQQKTASTAQLPALTSDAKGHPDETGLVIGTWRHGTQEGLVSVVFLASSHAVAAAAARQLAGQALAAGSYASQGLSRSATFAVPGVAGSEGSLYVTKAGQSPSGAIGIASWTDGRAVGLVEAITGAAGSARSDTLATATVSAGHLRTVEPGFTLAPTRFPGVATALWAAATAVLAAIAGGAPVLWRRRRDRLQREWAEEQERLIKVRGTTVVRTRRGQ